MSTWSCWQSTWEGLPPTTLTRSVRDSLLTVVSSRPGSWDSRSGPLWLWSITPAGPTRCAALQAGRSSWWPPGPSTRGRRSPTSTQSASMTPRGWPDRRSVLSISSNVSVRLVKNTGLSSPLSPPPCRTPRQRPSVRRSPVTCWALSVRRSKCCRTRPTLNGTPGT